jgi:hypothetical protein
MTKDIEDTMDSVEQADPNEETEDETPETPDMLEETGALTPEGEAGVPRPPTPDEEEALCASWKGYRDRVDTAQKVRAFWTEALAEGEPLDKKLAAMESTIEELKEENMDLTLKADETMRKRAMGWALRKVEAGIRMEATTAENLFRDAASELQKFESRNKAFVDKWSATTFDNVTRCLSCKHDHAGGEAGECDLNLRGDMDTVFACVGYEEKNTTPATDE